MNASRLKFGIPIKTESSRLIGILLHGIFSQNGNNIVQGEVISSNP